LNACNLDRSYFSPYDLKPKGVTRIACIYGKELLIATTKFGKMLLYALPLGEDAIFPLWEKCINLGTSFVKIMSEWIHLGKFFKYGKRAHSGVIKNLALKITRK
jgi:hypothetical protein